MADLSDVKKLLREVVGANPNLPITATVLSVTGDRCKVKLKSGLELTDVKLKATINDSENYILVTPKANSKVQILSLSGRLDNMTVIKVDEVEKIEIVQGELDIIIDSTDNKVGVKNSVCSLKDLFQEFADLLKQLKVYTPAGPSGTPLPDSILAITQLETKFNQLLK
ncbi:MULTISPECIES: hypothetical protein [Bizionia]|uniref:Uncharacterized protein n=1 Tax=Bizionia algoritergicola TaxID=291187 RepID=A0A5D0R261_9FLAO|nr:MULTISPECIES: hypothetical protein [Bizionia]OBX20956.1 hypothetical protein BAA08_14550 [Bizionia sp. APA-3]TYB74594.1 hypothetical protein ES675_00170 [Bizionia algoritergicola]